MVPSTHLMAAAVSQRTKHLQVAVTGTCIPLHHPLAIAEEVIARMAPRSREVLKLHRFEQLTYEEIAERLSVSRSTVKKDLADAMAEIAEALARKSGPGADSRTVRK